MRVTTPEGVAASVATVLPKAFWKRVHINPNGCWRWTGARVTTGYGVLRINRKPVLTHRLMYAHTHGDIPRMAVVMHSCDTPECCNPKHLTIGTHKENTQDMLRKGRHNWGAQRREAA